MQQIKNWSKIWKIERVFYKISNEISLPRPITQTFLTWFIILFVCSLKMNGIFPFMFSSALVNHLGIPFGIAFLLNRRTFQGKKPYNYLLTLLFFLIRSKRTRRGRRARKLYEHDFQHTVLIRERSEENEYT
ncbi:conjugal transfer protein [Enterococcus faecalis]|uniref:TcpE family conjugal transfer membrane protein n=1 Tax=Enterococcus TaxID=1350 RepID=UPI001A0EF26F|nr:TcpE family conjugal transfer membrane protein [Enterococcus faecalis]EGO8197139.1 conjugal transfer protein [Enterococcus faecalis]MBX8942281.1 conjugal transfer protein [Enterococcus faecalis]